ncbi:MAG: ATP-binding protein, partial [Muribaculaceae bacterium]|nr:ATP-binding protein [Muribaculaceae bacterium]
MAEDITVNDNQQQNSDFGGYDKLVTLTPREHIRLRPGMYIGKLGDGSQSDDGIYVLMKEVVDNSIDEFNTGFAKPSISIDIENGTVSIRDYGRGIPLDQVKDASSKMNTGAKYDTQNYKRSVGLNGVGIKAVNALSSSFYIRSVRDGMCSAVTYREGIVTDETGTIPAEADEENGTLVRFTPDDTIFKNYEYREDIVENMIKNYSFLN